MKNEMIIYDKGNEKINVSLFEHNVWLNIKQLVLLFNSSRSNITEHINNIYRDSELTKESTCRKIRQVQNEGGRKVERSIPHYNLDLIIAVGFRVNSKEAVKFRIWANNILKDYLVKGYVLDDDRLKNNGSSPYFENLLERIRDIRSSEKVFWRKILDIYATSIDYDSKNEITINFFKTVQNKIHYAVSKETAAEVIFNRVDATKDNIGLTNFRGQLPTKAETEIAKNYLTKDELNILNRMVSAYLDIAEINALSRKPMMMKDWIKELDSFLKMTHKDILSNKGTISHEKALKKAHAEYDKYMQNHLTTAEKDYLELMEEEVKSLQE